LIDITSAELVNVNLMLRQNYFKNHEYEV